MKASKKYCKKHNVLPKISFKDGKAHTVELVEDKIATYEDQQGQEKEGVKFKVIEDDIVKTFLTGSDALISKLSNKKEGDIVTIQMKKRKTPDGIKSFYTVVTGEGEALEEDKDEEIPVIEK